MLEGSLVGVSVLRIPRSLSEKVSERAVPLVSCEGENHIGSWALKSPRSRPSPEVRRGGDVR